jgi:hypothetical protein
MEFCFLTKKVHQNPINSMRSEKKRQYHCPERDADQTTRRTISTNDEQAQL